MLIPSFITTSAQSGTGGTLQTGLVDPELEALAVSSLRAAEESATCLALHAEWMFMSIEQKMPSGVMFDAMRGRGGVPVFIVRAQNGFHTSKVSFEDAYLQLVRGHRRRAYMLGETHEAILEAHGWISLRDAGREAQRIQKRVEDSNPTASDEEIDALVLAEIAAIKERRLNPPPPQPREGLVP